MPDTVNLERVHVHVCVRELPFEYSSKQSPLTFLNGCVVHLHCSCGYFLTTIKFCCFFLLPSLVCDFENCPCFLQITFTGYEAKTIDGCPTAEWVIRRSSKEELFLVIYRFHKGHTCNSPYTVVSIVLWDGLSQARALQLYRQLTDILPKYGCPTPRKCEKNERSVIQHLSPI